MRFRKNVEPEKREYLLQLLDKYESTYAMTKGERQELYKWVAQGNSPYDNSSLIADESGYPMDFVSALRAEKDLYEEFQKKTPEEPEEFYREQETV